MKRFTKFLSLFCVAGVALMLAACGKTQNPTQSPATQAPATQAPATQGPATQAGTEELNVLGNWAEIEQDGVYIVGDNSATELHFTYAKAEGKEWAGLYKEITVPAGYKSLIIEVVESGNFKLALLLDDNTKLEADLVSTTIKTTYAWHLKDADLTKVTAIQIFAAPGKFMGVGELHFTKMEFSKEVAGTNNEYIVHTGDKLIKSNAVEYEGGNTVNAALANTMFENDANTYTFEQLDNDGGVLVTKKETGHEWTFFKQDLVGIPQNFTLLTVQIKGKAGQKVLIKPDDNDGTGDNFYVIQTDDTVETFYVKVNPGCSKFLWFLSQKDAGSFTIVKAEISARAISKTSDSYVVGYKDNGDNIYEITENNGVATVNYNVPAGSWGTFNFLMSNASGSGMADDQALIVTVNGKAGTNLLVKLNDKLETYYTIKADNTNEKIVIQGDKLPKFFTKSHVFVNYNSSEATQGTLTISMKVGSAENSGEGPDTTVYDGKGGILDINHYWKGSNAFDINTNAGKTTIVKTGGDLYTSISTKTQDLSNAFVKAHVVISGTAGKKIIAKPNNDSAFETWITIPEGGKYDGYLAIPADMTQYILMFPNEIGATDIDTFVIEELKLLPDGDMVQVNTAVTKFEAERDDTVLKSTGDDGSLTFEYNQEGEWKYIQAYCYGNTSGLKLKVTVSNAACSKLLVKINDQIETWITVTDGAAVAEITGDKLAQTMERILLFFDGGETSSGQATVKLEWVSA